jgi:hypothetical protein
VLLRVHAHHEGGDVDDLLADTAKDRERGRVRMLAKCKHMLL